MKKNIFIIYIIAGLSFLILFPGCKKSQSVNLLGNWVSNNISPMGGVPRSQACAFVIGNNVYVGLGVDIQGNHLDDFWKWDINSGDWTRIDSMRDGSGKALPGRSSAVGFTIDSLGYVGTGVDDNFVYYKDFYSYSPTTNKWTCLKNDYFPGTPRYGAIGFGINHLGFVGTGNDYSYRNDFYKFNPVLPAGSRWTTMPAATIGQQRMYGGVFVIGTKAYICTGVNQQMLAYDLIIYDSVSDTWRTSGDSSISNQTETFNNFNSGYTDIVRQGAALFSIGGKGYVTFGADFNGSLVHSAHTWEYNPVTGLWTRKTPFPTTYWLACVYPVGISVFSTNRGFVGLGQNGNQVSDQFFEFKPENQYILGD